MNKKFARVKTIVNSLVVGMVITGLLIAILGNNDMAERFAVVANPLVLILTALIGGIFGGGFIKNKYGNGQGKAKSQPEIIKED